MRFAEIALLALPFVVFLAWRILAPAAGPPKLLVVAMSVTVVVMAGLLVGLWYEEAEPPGIGYVPAQLQDGRVVPGHAMPGMPSTGPVSPAGATRK